MGKYVGKNALTTFWNGIKAMFSDVAFSGDYDDLDSKPAVETAASGGTTKSLVTTGEKYDWNEKATVVEVTQAQYNALSEAKKMDGTVYMITDDDGGWEAERSIYDNTESGLSATNVQDALDEVASGIFQIKHQDISISIASGGVYANAEIPFSYDSIVGIAPIYNDNFYYDPVVASIRNNSNNVTIVVSSRQQLKTARTYSVRVWYV